VKAIGAPLGAKINDVLVAAMTGALRAYLKRRGVDVDGITVRAMVPVDLRPPGRASELGNEFGLVILELAIGAKDPLARVRRTKANMDELKRSPEAAAVLALFNLFGRTPKAVEDFAVQLFGSKASVVMTNVAGPMDPLYLAGVPIDRVMFWVPHPGKELGMGISILSYKGYATLAVIADAHLVPDPEADHRALPPRVRQPAAAVRRREEKMAPSGRRHARWPRKRAPSGQVLQARAALTAPPRALRRDGPRRGSGRVPPKPAGLPTCARRPPPAPQRHQLFVLGRGGLLIEREELDALQIRQARELGHVDVGAGGATEVLDQQCLLHFLAHQGVVDGLGRFHVLRALDQHHALRCQIGALDRVHQLDFLLPPATNSWRRTRS